ncbi:TrkA C-terminal domain-containing protein [Clostridium sp. DL1XJH146]
MWRIFFSRWGGEEFIILLTNTICEEAEIVAERLRKLINEHAFLHRIKVNASFGVTGYDEENLLMSLMAKQSGVKKVIAKLSRPNYTHIIKKLGVDVALNPVNISVSDVLKYIRGGKALSVSLLLGEQAEVTEVLVPDNSSYEGVSIEKLGFPKGVIVGAVIRTGTVIIPNGTTVIFPKDRLVIFCLTCKTKDLESFLGKSEGGLLNELQHRKKSIRDIISF